VGFMYATRLITTAGDEVELFGLLEAFEAGGHAARAVYIPPFAEARRMGHPSFFGVGGEWKGGAPATRHPRYWLGLCMGHPPLVNLPEQRLVFFRKWYREFHRKWIYTNTTS
jgi:hypothetical protein